MELIKIRQEPIFVVKFSRKELITLETCCQLSYDKKILSLRRKGGFVYGWFQKLDDTKDEQLEVELTIRQLDSLLKATSDTLERCKKENLQLDEFGLEVCPKLHEFLKEFLKEIKNG